SVFLRCISRGSEHSYGAFSVAVPRWRPAPGSRCRRSFSHSRASRPPGFTRWLPCSPAAPTLPVVHFVNAVEGDRRLEALAQRRPGGPPEEPPDLRDVRVEVPRLLPLSLAREGRELPARPREGREGLSDIAEFRRLPPADVQDLAERGVRARREKD